MLYIGFSNYSNKTISRLFCKQYKHCAPVLVNGDTVLIYQFVRINKISKIRIRKKDLKTLKMHGWKFVRYHKNSKQISHKICFTCVQFTKAVCGIKNINIQTPLALFKYLTDK